MDSEGDKLLAGADGKMTENYWRKKVAVEPLSAERAIAAMADWYSRVGTRRFKQYADEITRRSARDVQRGVWSVLDALGVKWRLDPKVGAEPRMIRR